MPDVRWQGLGADDYVTKPEAKDDVGPTIQQELIPKIKALVAKRGVRAEPVGTRPQLAATMLPARTPMVPLNVDVVAIAASTGGPNALAQLLRDVTPPLDTPLLIAQHMPAGFTTALAERLATKTGLAVVEATSDHAIREASVWVAQGGRHMLVRRSSDGVRISTNDESPENGCRPAADVLLRSVAEVYGSRALAIVLTGMGQDGLAGCRAIRASGGAVWVQDEASSIVWGMPGQVAKAGLAEQVLSLDDLSRALARRTKR